jgi:ABC-type nitrate/sulfonate/bicarbonate transport system substrate-binding protein
MCKHHATSLLSAALVLLLSAVMPASAQTKLNIITFSGAGNLPVWVALDKGFFAKEALDVAQEITSGSKPLMEGMMAGRYQFGSVALDNTIAYAEGQGDVKFDNFDLVGIMGVHSGMNKIVVRPEIKSFQDLKGKTAAVDSARSGYGLVMYKILEMNGLKREVDYKVIAFGSGPNRIAALKDGKAAVAAVSPPEDTNAQKEGFTVLADATELIGAYQGSAFIVRRSWAKDNEKTVTAFIRAMAAAADYVFENKAGAIEVLKARIKGLSDADAESMYKGLTSGKGGLNGGARINIEGVKMLLDLRNDYGGSVVKLTDPYTYIDLTYYEKATGKK